MLMKKPEHKRFEYQPRYYKPEKDKSEKLKERLEIARKSHLYKKKNKKVLIYFIFIVFIIYLAIKIGIF
jgi:hypothetical protein